MGGGVKDYVTTILNLVLKSVTLRGEGVSEIIKNCVTSHMDDPSTIVNEVRYYRSLFGQNRHGRPEGGGARGL